MKPNILIDQKFFPSISILILSWLLDIFSKIAFRILTIQGTWCINILSVDSLLRLFKIKSITIIKPSTDFKFKFYKNNTANVYNYILKI